MADQEYEEKKEFYEKRWFYETTITVRVLSNERLPKGLTLEEYASRDRSGHAAVITEEKDPIARSSEMASKFLAKTELTEEAQAEVIKNGFKV